MRRAAIALALAVAGAVLLAACGSTGSDSSATTTATVPAGTLGDSGAFKVNQGAYAGTTADGLGITFTVKDDKVLGFTVGRQVFAASMTMYVTPPRIHYQRSHDVVVGSWQSPGRVSGDLVVQELDGKKVRTSWQATG